MRDNHRTSIKFWGKVNVKSDNECWEYTGPKSSIGYGYARPENGNITTANRAAWVWLYGSVPDDMEVCHSCSNKLCVNPSHLYLSSKKENLRELAYRKDYLYPKSLTDIELNTAIKKARNENILYKLSNIDFESVDYKTIETIYSILSGSEIKSNSIINIDVMPCGHKKEYIVSSNEGTSYCLMCEFIKDHELVRTIIKAVDNWNM